MNDYYVYEILNKDSKISVINLKTNSFKQSKSGEITETDKASKVNLLEISLMSPSLTDFSLLASSPKRAPISLHLKRKIFAEAQGCCQFESSDGIQCGSQFQVQFDHITPVTWGGSNSIDNFRLLCRTHNLLMARLMGLH